MLIRFCRLLPVLCLPVLALAQAAAPATNLPREEVAPGRGFGMGPPATPEIVARALAAEPTPLPAGPVQPSWESVRANYATPEWFRDAKFGALLVVARTSGRVSQP